MYRYLCALVALIVSLAGCATYPDLNRQRLENLPHHYSQFDALLSWEERPVGDQLLVDGVYKNIRWDYEDNIEIWVAVLSPAGKILARSVSFVIPQELRLDEMAPFSLKLPVRAAPGLKLRFTYKYRASEGSSQEGAGRIDWMQSFDTELSARP